MRMSKKKISNESHYRICIPTRETYVPRDTTDATQIIPGLYLGNYSSVKDCDLIRRLNVTTILCTAKECVIPEWIKSSQLPIYNVKHIPMEDTSEENIEGWFDEATNFIQAAVNRHENVLVYCYMGVSRSASIVTAYLIQQMKMDYTSAFDVVKTARNIVSPNLGFCIQLRKLAEKNTEPCSKLPLSSTHVQPTSIYS